MQLEPDHELTQRLEMMHNILQKGLTLTLLLWNFIERIGCSACVLRVGNGWGQSIMCSKHLIASFLQLLRQVFTDQGWLNGWVTLAYYAEGGYGSLIWSA